MDLNIRMDYDAHSPVQREAKKHDGMESIQWMKDKIGRTKGWAVCYSKFNKDDKSITFECLTGNREASGTSMEHMSYEEICRLFWWKSFDVLGPDTIKPVKMTLAERDEIERPHIKNAKAAENVIEVDEDKIQAEADAEAHEFEADVDAGDQEDVQS